jgi:outer membrane lipoprotein carrier protein
MTYFNQRRLCAVAVLVLAAAVCAAAAQAPSLVDELRAKYGKQVTLQTSFDLEIMWKVREKTEKKSGTLQIAPDDKFRLELDNTVWVSDGLTYWQYSKATSQVVIKKLVDVDLSMHPSQIITTYLFDYSYAIKDENDKQAVLEWTAPQDDAKAYAKAITMWVDKKKMILKKLHVVDTNGNESTYDFKKTKVGGDIPAETFRLAIPEGASVLDTRD